MFRHLWMWMFSRIFVCLQETHTHTLLLPLFFFPSPDACRADFSVAGRRGEPQLLSDVNAAQMLCLCGHSPSHSSNQLMSYLTLPFSPLSSAFSLNFTDGWHTQPERNVESPGRKNSHIDLEWSLLSLSLSVCLCVCSTHNIDKCT